MKAITFTFLVLFLTTLAKASIATEPNSLVRALRTVDHVALQSFSAVFSRKQQAQHSIFGKASEALRNQPEISAWTNRVQLRAPDESGYCGVDLIKVSSTQWIAKRQTCKGSSETELVRITRFEGGTIELSLPLSSWVNDIAMGQTARNSYTTCQFSFRNRSLDRAHCEGIHFATSDGQEVHLEELIYNQSTADVASVTGKLYRKPGLSEDIKLKAPARGSKIFVELVQKEVVTAPAQQIAQSSPEAAAQAETPVKTDEQILDEMKELAEDWEPWAVQKKVYGDSEASTPEEAYADQDLSPRPEEALPAEDNVEDTAIMDTDTEEAGVEEADVEEGDLEEDDVEQADADSDADADADAEVQADLEENQTENETYEEDSELSPMEAAKQMGHKVRPNARVSNNG